MLKTDCPCDRRFRGTLDILFAMILTVAFGRRSANMLRSVASGPFPAATGMGTAGAILGLIVHFALMAIMAAGFMLLVRWRPHCSMPRCSPASLMAWSPISS